MRQKSVWTGAWLVALCMYLALGPVVVAQEAQTYDLRPVWTEGQHARYQIWTQRTQNISMSLAGQSRDAQVVLTSEGEVSWNVDKVKADGSSTCTMTIDWLSIEINPNGGKKIVNDSRKGSGDIEAFHKMLKAMTGAPVKVSVAADGTITKVTGINAISARLPAEQKESAPDELDFIETASDLASLIAAPASAEPGKTWDTDLKWNWSDTPFKGFLNYDMKYTFTGVEQLADVPVAVIDGQSKIKLDVDRSKLPDNMPPTDVKLVKGDIQTQVLFDLTRHEAVGRNSIQNMTINYVVSLPQNNKLNRRVVETIQGQVLRLEEE